MKNFNSSAIVLAIGLAFSVGVMAESMSKEQYKYLEKNLEAEYKAANARCDSLAGNANDICVAQAKGNMNITKSELAANYKPSVKTRYDASSAKADADYSVAIVKCNDKAGNNKDVCVKEATASKSHEIADAMDQIRTSKPDAIANEQPADTNAR